MRDPRLGALIDAFVDDLAEIIRRATLEQLQSVTRASALAPRAAKRAPKRPRPAAPEAPLAAPLPPGGAAREAAATPPSMAEKRKIRREARAGADSTRQATAEAGRAEEAATHPFVLRRNGERVRRLK